MANLINTVVLSKDFNTYIVNPANQAKDASANGKISATDLI